ncbi:TetR/AcrR family transcriptional regulator [Streptomyces paludis]|uniref:TetR/AcrR family transcriptional regulator n=1 Tax=Streptomyces paludis TaxID=2282738 RepID=A0A345HX16_9ACTN|nr:TetR/AcrR family transcriptional regulator [Streptomyces paludis]AXG81240.1 TetR/AcrR family transcriptional regulator [Streptomyces paludis]
MSGLQRGRPRSAHAHQAVLAAAVELLTSGGYQRLTMEAIAAKAGVGKQTVYRWWPSKAAIVAEAVLSGHLAAAASPLAETGDVVTDLRDWLSGQLARLTDPSSTALLRGLTAAAAESDDDAAKLYERFTGPFRQYVVRRLAIGVQQGQLRPDARLDAAADFVIGALIYRTLTHGNLSGQGGVDDLIEVLLAGLGPRPGTTATSPG